MERGMELLRWMEADEGREAAGALRCNKWTAPYGLMLTERQAARLAAVQRESLQATGRVAFQSGMLERFIEAFCDSPFIPSHAYGETLERLIRLFYEAKRETMDLVSDGELLSFLSKAFGGPCQGSLDLLEDRELARYAKAIRSGATPLQAEEAVLSAGGPEQARLDGEGGEDDAEE